MDVFNSSLIFQLFYSSCSSLQDHFKHANNNGYNSYIPWYFFSVGKSWILIQFLTIFLYVKKIASTDTSSFLCLQSLALTSWPRLHDPFEFLSSIGLTINYKKTECKVVRTGEAVKGVSFELETSESSRNRNLTI